MIHSLAAVSTRPICMTVLCSSSIFWLQTLLFFFSFIIVITVINNHIAVYACIYRGTSRTFCWAIPLQIVYVCVAGETRINYSNVFALCEHVTLFCTSFCLARSLCRLNVFLASYWHLVHICANIRLLSAPYATTCEVRVRERLQTRKMFNALCSRKLFHHF